MEMNEKYERVFNQVKRVEELQDQATLLMEASDILRRTSSHVTGLELGEGFAVREKIEKAATNLRKRAQEIKDIFATDYPG